MSQQNKSRITVDIHGQQYTIVGDENANHIRMVASMVDGKMKEISEANPYLDTNKLAVLTAVNIVSEYLNLKEDYNELMKKITKEEEATKDD